MKPSVNNQMDLLLYSFAALMNSFSTSLLLVVFGLVGKTALVADIAITQAATMALFQAFSANARGIVLAEGGLSTAKHQLQIRKILVGPLALMSWVLAVSVGNATQILAAILILRKMSEWFGEIGLAVHERKDSVVFAKQTILGELASVSLFLVATLFLPDDFLICGFLWAMSPLLATRKLMLKTYQAGRYQLKSFAPHLGSSVIVGAGVYVFRITVFLLVGKAASGVLFTAFAIGGIIPTILGQGLAPTLALRYKTAVWLTRLLPIPIALIFIGLTQVLLIHLNLFLFDSLNDNRHFWMAVGWSVAGGGVMFVAAALKARLVQRHEARDVFGSDLMANLLIIISTPFVYSLLGVEWMMGLYLFSACINFIFIAYSGAGRGVDANRRAFVMYALGFCLAVPIFFQLNGSFFLDPSTLLNTEVSISNTPIPISVVALIIGVAIFGNYQIAIRSLLALFFTVILFLLSTLFVIQDNQSELGSKIMMFGQYVFPMFGLVLGEMYGDASPKPIFERSALLMLILILPAQLIATWMAGYTSLQPNIFIISIYQHLLYLPMIVAALTIMACFGLWKESAILRNVLVICVPIVITYMLSALSVVGTIGLIVGLSCFAGWHWIHRIAPRKLLLMLGTAVMFGLFHIWFSYTGQLAAWVRPANGNYDEMTWAIKFKMEGESGLTAVPLAVRERNEILKVYITELVESPSGFFIGHASHKPNAEFPNARNYWLDAIYNFGIISLIPLIVLVVSTVISAFKIRKYILRDPLLLGTFIASSYLVGVEGFLKAGLSQIYPGILTFFIWGLLLVRMRKQHFHFDRQSRSL